MLWEFNVAVNIFGAAIVNIMKIDSLLGLPATALLLGLSSLSFPRTTVSSNLYIAQFSRTGILPVPQKVEQASCLLLTEVQDLSSNTLLAQSQPKPSQERRHPPRIDFATAAKKLGVTEAQLIEALGLPAKPPAPPTQNNRPPSPPPPPPLDIPGAAKKLGVTEAQLIKFLGIPPRPPGDRNLPQNSEKR
jgi:U5 snRNP spliceosome subunit